MHPSNSSVPFTGSCPGGLAGFWNYDDFQLCQRQRYVELYLAVIALTIGILYSLLRAAQAWRFRSASRLAEYGKDAFHPDDAADKNATIVIRGRSVSDRLRLVAEFALNLVQTTLLAVVWRSDEAAGYYAKYAPRAPAAVFLLGLYTLALSAYRLAAANRRTPLIIGPFTQQAYIYTIFLTTFLLEWYSYATHPKSRAATRIASALLIIAATNWTILFTSPIGDSSARLYTAKGSIPSSEPTSSLLRYMGCCWNASMIIESTKSPITEEKVWDLTEDDHVYRFMAAINLWPAKWSFFTRLCIALRKPIVLNILFGCTGSVLKLAPTIFIQQILKYVETRAVPPSVAWVYVFGLGMVYLIEAVTMNQAFYQGRKLSLGVRSLIIGSVYRKALHSKISSTKPSKDSDSDSEGDNASAKDDESDNSEAIDEFDTSNTGAVINLMSVDSFKVADFASYLHDDFATPILLVLAIWFLYGIIGWSAFVAVGVMLILMPINVVIAQRMSNVQERLMAVTDRRIEKTNEMLGAIRVIKFYAWERQFTENILEIREQELRLLLWRFVYWIASSFVLFLMPIFVIVTSFWCFVRFQGGNLTSSVAFTAMSVFYIIRMPLDDLTNMITRLSSLLVSVRRIEKYLAVEETPKYQQLESPRATAGASEPNSGEIIGFSNASFTWGLGNKNGTTDDSFKLRDIDVKFVVGDLNVIVGATGSGKSSLIMALLGEMQLEKGHVYLPQGNRRVAPIDKATGLTDTVAYCPQEAWLVNDTIKNNILFAQKYDKQRYNKVLDVCQLRHDLEILTDGDQTFIGDKGIALSGGQKQRVSIARAIYSNSKHIIFDDCLSAVDSHTAEALYNEALTGSIAFGRTIILVSHNVALTIGKAALVAVVANGRVVSQGSPLEVSASGHLGEDDLIRRNAESSSASRSASALNLPSLNTAARGSAELNQVAHENERSERLASGHDITGALGGHNNVEEDVVDAVREDEERAVGSVPLSTYKTYIMMQASRAGLIVCGILMVLVPIMDSAQSWWVKVWTSNMGDVDEESASIKVMATISQRRHSMPLLIGKGSVDGDTLATLRYYCLIYVLIGLAYTITALSREFIIGVGGLRAARKYFKHLLRSVAGAQMRFFDSTPSGRIINRFSKDMETIDQDISADLLWFMINVVETLQISALIAWVTPIFIPLALIVVWAFSLVGRAYLAAARELKRLESVSRSPIFQQFSETLGGSVVIRAYGDEQRFQTTNWNAIDATHRPYFWLWVSNRWLGFWCNMTSLVVCISAASLIVFGADYINAGMAGISLSFSTYFGDCILWIVRNYAQCEVSMNSVERVNEYLSIEQEAPAIIPESRPPALWPSKGDIKFQDLSLRYSPSLPRVINNVSFHVPGGKKVGIVGRTGAGKSTIITAMFRLLEPDSGSITIDDLDISTIGLEDLRKGLSIIPQDPTLFKGTLRSNLDLFGEYKDADIFQALGRVNLVPTGTTAEAAAAAVATGTDGENANQFFDLESEVTEGGRNLSQGQRQLICLARAILKEPRILLLDEATASIDYETDATIQKTIRHSFDNVTILTIAHRLRTIADYDIILVLEKGGVAQYGHPDDLLQDKEGIFYNMCAKSGELETLLSLAKEAKARTSREEEAGTAK